MTPRKPPSGDRLPKLSDTDEELLAIAEERAEKVAEAAVQKAREDLTGETPMKPSPTPSPGVLWDEGAAAIHMNKCSEPNGPIGKLRAELKEHHEQREKSMNRKLVIIGLLITACTGGIQLWGKWSERTASALGMERERNAAAIEMSKAIAEVKSELTALRSAVKP